MFDVLNSLSALQIILLCVLVSVVGSVVACAIASGNNLPDRND